MLAALIITFRETLEASLVVGILLAYLSKTENTKHKKFIWAAVGLGILISVILAIVFETYFGGFEGMVEEVYEGVIMLVAAALVSWMIVWMLRQRRNLRKNLENKMQTHIEKDHPWGMFFLTLASVAREGIETVIFLKAASLQANGANIVLGGIIGIVIAIVVSVLLFEGITKFEIRKFFTITSVILILFAAGLLAHGLHEFQEAGLIPTVIEHLWDTNSILNEKGTLGSIMKGLFGYNGNPSLIEVLSYWGYLIAIFGAWGITERKQND